MSPVHPDPHLQPLQAPDENHWKSNIRNYDKILSITVVTLEESRGTDNTE